MRVHFQLLGDIFFLLKLLRIYGDNEHPIACIITVDGHRAPNGYPDFGNSRFYVRIDLL